MPNTINAVCVDIRSYRTSQYTDEVHCLFPNINTLDPTTFHIVPVSYKLSFIQPSFIYIVDEESGRCDV